MPPLAGHGRRYLRVPLNIEAWLSWGYERIRCVITEFSTHGLTVKGLHAPIGTPLSLQFPLPDGTFTLCGVVVHRSGPEASAGVRLFDLPPALQVDLEIYLWGLLAASSLPQDPKSCSAVGCRRPHKARGLCSLHYGQWRRHHRRDPAGGSEPEGELFS
jgi:hypothetical protein